MKKVILCAALLTVIFTPIAEAKKSPRKGGLCFTNYAVIQDTNVIWSCEHIGKVKLREVYSKGWRVIGIFESSMKSAAHNYPILVIEEQ